MHQRIVMLLAAVVFMLTGITSAAAQQTTPEPATPPSTPTTDWLAEWAPGQTATINGAENYFEDHGDPHGQPVLLLHGGLGNTEEFINLTPVLVSAGYRVIALDCRGHGRSTWGDLPITYDQMAADAIRLFDYLDID
jgi:alpha-beta hydrolase superfamily lysophospholipase